MLKSLSALLLGLLLQVVGVTPLHGVTQEDSINIYLNRFSSMEGLEELGELQAVGHHLLQNRIHMFNLQSGGQLRIMLIDNADQVNSIEKEFLEAAAPSSPDATAPSPDYWLVVEYWHREDNVILFARLHEPPNRRYPIPEQRSSIERVTQALGALAAKILKEVYRLHKTDLTLDTGTRSIALTLFEPTTSGSPPSFARSIPNRLRAVLEASTLPLVFPDEPTLQESVDADGNVDARALANKEIYKGVDLILTGAYVGTETAVTIHYELISRATGRALAVGSKSGPIERFFELLASIVEEIDGKWGAIVAKLQSQGG